MCYKILGKMKIKSCIRGNSHLLVFIGLFISGINMVSAQKQITENLKCTYLGNSFGGGTRWVQNYIDDMYVNPEGTVYTSSVWDEAHREYGVYTKCDVIGNTNKKPNSLVATDSKGNTWTVQNPCLRFMLGLGNSDEPVPAGNNAPYITCSDGREIRDIPDPSAIAIDNKGRLMVADNGPDQNIKVFDISGSGVPVPVDTIGVVGGAMGGDRRGQVEPLKFWGIRGLGTDSKGNLWVASCGFPSQVGGGTDLRHFDTLMQMDCQLLDLNFVASMDADPTDPTQIYSHEEHHELDYYAIPGDLQSHWNYKAVTIDPFTYPDDPRITISLESVFMRYIDGKKYMFLTDMYQQFLIVYRFEGEIAIPAAFFCVAWDGQWDKYTWQMDKRPKWTDGNGKRWLWRDNNGDGQVQKDEFSIYDLEYPYVKGLEIDQNGNVFIGARKLFYFPINGLDANGVPNYSVTTFEKSNSPIESESYGGDITRIEYVDDTDVMYFGFDGEFPDFTKIVRYKNWSKGERNGDTLALGQKTVTFAADEKYIYSNCGSGGKYTRNNGEIDVWDAESLNPVGYILPGEEVFGESGWLDLGYSLKVSKLASGERIIIAEEDWKGKNTVYKWCPEGNCSTPDFSIRLTSPVADSVYSNSGAILFEAVVDSGNSTITRVEFYAQNEKIGEALNAPCTFNWENPPMGTYMVYAKAIDENGKSVKSNYFGLKISDGTPEIYLQSPSYAYNYTLLDTIVFSAEAYDYNGTIQHVEFFSNDILIGSLISKPFRLTWDSPVAGQYTIYAKVTDDEGNQAVTPSIEINITDQIDLSFLSPSNNLMISEGEDFDIQLNTNSFGNIKNIAYYNNDTLLTTCSNAPFTYGLNNAMAGIYTISARVTLNDNRQLTVKGPQVFVLPSVSDCDHKGMMNLDLWYGVEGTSISAIPDETFPSESRMTDVFEGPTNIADNYGERICGYLCPPQTGLYTFWTSGDDNNQFRIKLADSDTLSVIAFVDGWTPVRAWENMASQKSEPVMLQAGQMYLVEGLLKEGSGGDNFAVGWQLPDGTMERPIAGEHLIPLYDPLTLRDDVSVKIISPADGAVFSTNDSIKIIAEVQNGNENVSSMKFFSGANKELGRVDKTNDNVYAFSVKLTKGKYKLAAKALYKHLLTIPSSEIAISVTTTTSVNDLNTEEQFEVFPNPLMHGSLSVRLPEVAERLRIFDINGKLVYQDNTRNSEYTVLQSAFKTEGVYLVTISTNGYSINKKVIVIK
jgi:hypothetical protein